MAGKKLKRRNGDKKIKPEENSNIVVKSKKVDENMSCNNIGKSKKSEDDSNIQRCINKVVIKPIVKIKATVEGLETSMV